MLCVSFFFFTQNTAYELRISYWFSDVCSSDLRFAKRVATHRRVAERAERAWPHLHAHVEADQFIAAGVACAVEQAQQAVQIETPADRQSLVTGTSVSVRLYLGCLLIMNTNI